MAEMTKEKFLSGIPFFPKKSSNFLYAFEASNDTIGYLKCTTDLAFGMRFWASISKIDSKGFNYFSYQMMGKDRHQARVYFSDLIAVEPKETEVSNG